MHSFFLPIVVTLNVIMPRVMMSAMLSVAMQSVIMLIVVARVKKSGTTVVRTIVVEAKVEKV